MRFTRQGIVGTSVCLALVGCLMLAGCTSHVPKPTATPTLPQAPLAARDLKCIQAAGWQGAIDWQGTINSIGLKTQDQVTQWQSVADKCGKKTGFYDTKLSTAQLVQLYGQELKERACLAKAGFPSAEPPSQQTFIDTWYSADQYQAFIAAGGQSWSESKQQTISKQCPPPTWFLNLDGL